MKYLAQIRDAIFGYGLAFLAVAASLLWGLLQREKAQQATEDAAEANAAQKRSQDVSAALVEGEAKAQEEIADAVDTAKHSRGHFSK